MKVRTILSLALLLVMMFTACAPAATPVPATEAVETATSPEVPTAR